MYNVQTRCTLRVAEENLDDDTNEGEEGDDFDETTGDDDEW